MSEYPSDWNIVPIREIISESRINPALDDPSKRISVRLHCEGVEKRSERATDQAGSTRYYKRLAGQFIYGKQNLHKGAVGIVPSELHGFCSSQDIPAFDIAQSVDPEWFLHLFRQRNFYESLESIATGTGSKRIQPSELGEKEIAVPPLPEQKKIAEIISGIENLIHSLQRKERKLRASLEAVANSWQTLDLSDGDHAVTCSMGDLIDSIDSGWSPPCESAPPGINEWGVLKVSAVTAGVFREEESKKLPSNETPRERCVVKQGDLLITRANGNPDLVGRGAIVSRKPLSKLMMPDLLLRLRPSEKCSAEFLLILLNSQDTRTQIETHLRGSTGAKKINQSLLRSLSVSCPRLETQRKVVLLSSLLSNSLEVILRKLDSLADLKQSMSADLISGRKRVSV